MNLYQLNSHCLYHKVNRLPKVGKSRNRFITKANSLNKQKYYLFKKGELGEMRQDKED